MLTGRIAASWCVWLLAATLPAASPVAPETTIDRYRHEVWKVDSGLPDNEVQALCQTRDGYLWIGTRSGLARFDGLRFTLFNRLNTPAFENDDILALAEDAAGNLWIGLRGALVCKRRATFVRVSSQEPITAVAGSLVGTQDGDVYAGHGHGLYRVAAGSTWPLVAEPALSSPSHCLLEHPAGRLWIGGRGQIGILNLTDGSLARDARHPLGANQEVHALAVDGRGRFFMLASVDAEQTHAARLWELGSEGWVCPNESVLQNGGRRMFLTPSSSGSLWMPDSQAVLLNYRDGEFTRHPMPFQDFPICALEDREGNLWVGTESEGLHGFYRPSLATLTDEDGLPDPSTRAILQARDGSMWIGTDGGVVQFTESGRNSFTHQFNSSRRRIRALAEDRAGRIWVGTGSSLDCIADDQVRSHRFPGPWWNTKVRALLVTRSNTLWVGSAGGLYGVNLDSHQDAASSAWEPVLLTPHTTLSATNGLAVDDVRTLLEDREGALWIGTAGGGVFCRKDHELRSFTMTNGLADNYIWSLHEDADGTLWIGSANGLHRLRNGRIVVFGREQGLAENTINEILEDNNGTLWLGGDRGVYAVKKADLEKVAAGRIAKAPCAAYKEADGLPSNEINAQINQPAGWKCRQGRLWFSTTRGVAIIDPERAAAQSMAPTVIIEQVRARGRPVFGDGALDGSEPLLLPPEESGFLQISYTATGLAAAGRLQFRYRLLGLDQDWIEAGRQREISYANLAPGTYTFQVTAGTPQNSWNETGTSLAFTIEPRLDQTASFRVTVAALVAFAIVGAVCLFIGKSRQRQEAAQQSALRKQRTQISRDLHDEIGAVLAQMARLARTPASEYSDAVRQSIAALSQEALHHFDDLIWLGNPRFDTLADLVSYLREYAAKYLNECGLRAQFEFPADPDECPVSSHFRREVVLLLKEALNNVLRHAQARSVRVAVMIDRSLLIVEIADDGRGLDLGAPRTRGQGLENMRQRASSLGGTFEIVSAPGQGTRIICSLPLRSHQNRDRTGNASGFLRRRRAAGPAAETLNGQHR